MQAESRVDNIKHPCSVLVVTALYPHRENTAEGIFIKNQIASLVAADPNMRFDVLYLQGNGKARYLLGILRTFAATLTNRYSVVHVHYGLAAWSALLRFRTPMVVTLHGSDVNIPWQRRLTKLACRFANAVIAVSEDLRTRIGMDAAVIPVGIDLTMFQELDRSSCRERLGLPLDQPVVLFPADPERGIKRFDLFQQAVDELRAQGRVVHILTLAGDPYTYDEMPLVLNAASVVVLTSDSEGSPMVIKEAMACNTPIVSVPVGDVPALIGNTKGCYIATRDPADIAAKMALALDGPSRTEGRARVAHLDDPIIARQILAVYDRATGHPSRR